MLYKELLEQAEHLTRKEPRRPKDASLRRAVSAAYYSLFHFLIGESTGFLIPGRRKDLRFRLARSFVHQHMKDVAAKVAGANFPAPPELKSFAEVFVFLQQERHDADYNLVRRFGKAEVQGLVSRARTALNDWSSIGGAPETEDFLVSLLVKLR